jgi:uncharacterized membrane protein YidH (DUF202 family)
MFMLQKLNKKGQTLDLATGTIVGLVLMIFVVFAVLFGIAALNPASFFTAGSASANATIALQDNTTRVVSNFSQQLPTVGTILGVVLILAALAILILVITRFRSNSGGAGGSL